MEYAVLPAGPYEVDRVADVEGRQIVAVGLTNVPNPRYCFDWFINKH